MRGCPRKTPPGACGQHKRSGPVSGMVRGRISSGDQHAVRDTATRYGRSQSPEDFAYTQNQLHPLNDMYRQYSGLGSQRHVRRRPSDSGAVVQLQSRAHPPRLEDISASELDISKRRFATMYLQRNGLQVPPGSRYLSAEVGQHHSPHLVTVFQQTDTDHKTTLTSSSRSSGVVPMDVDLVSG